MTHDFLNSLKKSHEQADSSWWLDVYKKAFPDLEAEVSVRNDGWAQRGGIDRVLTLSSGKTLTVDEKVRYKDYPDILLEYWSDEARKIRGWVAKDMACDFIAYAFVNSGTCYLLPFQTLRAAWRLNHKEWCERYGRCEADNGRYTTVSVPVPIKVLMPALNDAMKITCNNLEAA